MGRGGEEPSVSGGTGREQSQKRCDEADVLAVSTVQLHGPAPAQLLQPHDTLFLFTPIPPSGMMV